MELSAHSIGLPNALNFVLLHLVKLTLAPALLLLSAHSASAQTLMALEAEFSEVDVDLILLQVQPLPADVLDESREGFTMPSNVTIDIGFENMVLIDGVLQAHTRLTLDGLLAGSFSAETVQAHASTPPGDALVTLSSDALTTIPGHALAVSRVAIGEMGLPLQTLIQNNQDNRTIQSLQVLNIEFGNMGNGFFGPLNQLMNLQAIEAIR